MLRGLLGLFLGFGGGSSATGPDDDGEEGSAKGTARLSPLSLSPSFLSLSLNRSLSEVTAL